MFELLLKLIGLCNKLQDNAEKESEGFTYSMEINEFGRVTMIFLRRENLPRNDKLFALFSIGEETFEFVVFKKKGLFDMTLKNIELVRAIIFTMEEMKKLDIEIRSKQ